MTDLIDAFDEDGELLHPIEGFFTDVFTAEMKPPAWVVENLIPVGLTFIGAPPKSGKSTIVTAIAAMVAGYKCKALPKDMSVVSQKGVVYLFSAEADAGELRHMLEEGLGVDGAPDGSILVCDDPWAYRLDQDADQKQLMFWLNQRMPALTVLDPLRNFHALEEKDSAAMIQILGPLRQWASKNQRAVIVVHHTRKLEEGANRTYTATDMRGSSALFGLADAVLMVTPTRTEMQVTVDAVFKRAPAWQKTVQLAAYDAKGQSTTPVTATMQLILDAIEHGYTTVDEIQEHTGVARKTIMDRLKLMKENELVGYSNKQWARL